MEDINLPVKIEKEEKLERGYGFYNEYKIIDNSNGVIAIFYKEHLANGYCALLNSFQSVSK